MMTAKKRTAATLAAGLMLGSALTMGAAHADLLGSVLKGGAIAILIKQFNRPINDALNKLTGTAGAQVREATKVVPIISAGDGTYVGAAQVSGPQAALNRVQVVGMLQTDINSNQFRLKALVPTDTKNFTKGSISRVKGVGVSAIIDIKI